jgi:hypothetical protein
MRYAAFLGCVCIENIVYFCCTVLYRTTKDGHNDRSSDDHPATTVSGAHTAAVVPASSSKHSSIPQVAPPNFSPLWRTDLQLVVCASQ